MSSTLERRNPKMDNSNKVTIDMSLTLKDMTAFTLKLYKGEKEGWHTVEVGETVTLGTKDYVVISIEPNKVLLRPVEDEISGQNV